MIIRQRDYTWLRFFYRERTIREAYEAREAAFGSSIWIGYGSAYTAIRRLVDAGLLAMTRRRYPETMTFGGSDSTT